MRFYLNRQDPAQAVDDLNAGLSKLSLGDNFVGFYWEGDIAANTEVAIRNLFRDGEVPYGYIPVSIWGQNTLVRGTTEWNERKVYLKNSASSGGLKARVFFFKGP